MQRVVADRYTLVRPLGRGGMGEVWLGRDTRLDRDVAVKLLRPSVLPAGADVDALVSRFAREARLTAKLENPGVPAVYDTGTDDDDLFLVMQLIGGADLAEFQAENEPVPVAWVIAIGAQIASVLGAAHAAGLIHRDLKPRNVMITDNGEIKVLDFGIAVLRDADVTRITRTSEAVGTPAYMAPEQAMHGQFSPSSDLYSLGCVLYELLTGRYVFEAQTPLAMMHRHYSDTPEPVLSLRPDAGHRLADLITRLLAKKPEARPVDAREVYDTLLPLLPQPTGPLIPMDPTRPFRDQLSVPQRPERTGSVVLPPGAAPPSPGQPFGDWFAQSPPPSQAPFGDHARRPDGGPFAPPGQPVFGDQADRSGGQSPPLAAPAAFGSPGSAQSPGGLPGFGQQFGVGQAQAAPGSLSPAQPPAASSSAAQAQQFGDRPPQPASVPGMAQFSGPHGTSVDVPSAIASAGQLSAPNGIPADSPTMPVMRPLTQPPHPTAVSGPMLALDTPGRRMWEGTLIMFGVTALAVYIAELVSGKQIADPAATVAIGLIPLFFGVRMRKRRMGLPHFWSIGGFRRPPRVASRAELVLERVLLSLGGVMFLVYSVSTIVYLTGTGTWNFATTTPASGIIFSLGLLVPGVLMRQHRLGRPYPWTP